MNWFKLPPCIDSIVMKQLPAHPAAPAGTLSRLSLQCIRAWRIVSTVGAVSAAVLWGQTACAQDAQPLPSSIAPFAAPGASKIQPPWKVEPFPGSADKKPASFSIETVDGVAALRIAADNAYGTLSHPWPDASPGIITWRWRLDQPLAGTDIETKAGDDNALKVCTLFDQPLDQIPFLERAALELARATTSIPLPAATVCYLWDSHYPAGHTGRNPYTGRVRYIVLRGPEAPLAHWENERRDVGADFEKLFGSESPRVPPMLAVAVGADSDNTHGSSVAYVAALKWIR